MIRSYCQHYNETASIECGSMIFLGGQGGQRTEEAFTTREAEEEIDALKKLVQENRITVNENREAIKEIKAMLQELLSRQQCFSSC